MNEVVIPLKLSGIAALKAELKDLKNQMADAANPEVFAALADKAGDVQKQISKVNNSINEFKKGSNLDQAKASFDAMGESIMKLDFTKAAKQSANLKQTLGTLTPADLTKGFKGFITTIKNVGGAFVKLGITILANPIFLIVAVVTAIIAVIALVLNKFGLLDGVIKALMAPINALIAGFKSMTDWLGLTSFAAEDNAEKTAAANKKVSESSKAREAQVVGDLGREIAELKAAGEETAKLEEEVSNTKIREANKRKEAAKVELEATKKLDSRYNKAKLEELKKQVDAENEIIKQANSDKVVARNAANKKEIDDLKTKADANNKEAESKAKTARDKRLAADKASEDQIAAARKIVTDSTKTAQQIELDDLAAAYKKKIDEAVKYKNDTTALVEAQKVQEAEINKKYTDAANAKTAEDNKKRIAAEDAQFLEMQRLTLSDVEFKKLQATQAAEAKMDIFYKDAEMVKLLEKELAAELVKIQDDADKQKTAKLKEETDKQNKIKEDARQLEIKGIQDNLDTAAAALNSINSLTSIGMDAKLKGVKKGSKEEEKILKQQFKQQKAMQLAMAAINGAQAILAILTVPDFTLGIASGIRIAAAVAATAASIATISGTQFEGGGSTPNTPDVGGGGTSTTAVAPASGPNLFGQANTGSQVNAGGSSSNNITVTAVVSETEMTATQHFINNIQQNSVL
jgi:hypothetical protein